MASPATRAGALGERTGSADAKALAGNEEISRTAESILQEILLKANRKRVYEALTDAEQFTKVMGLSKFSGGPAAMISREAGGPFSLFGDHIVGRHIELVPNVRLVQAWRAASWEPGNYSIVRFDLKEQGNQTKIVFEHTGFPMGLAEHLLEGWNSNYWEPLRKYLD
jgi:activator of HSP90 ATPase